MTFPEKFKHLRDISRGSVEPPEVVWLTYAACAYDDDACGWQGWLLEAVLRADAALSAKTDQICPNCGKTLFRTEASWRLEPSENQSQELRAGRDYDISEETFENSREES